MQNSTDLSEEKIKADGRKKKTKQNKTSQPFVLLRFVTAVQGSV